MDIDSEDQSSERVQIHFLTALVDELIKSLVASGVMSRSQAQEVESAVAEKMGIPPRLW